MNTNPSLGTGFAGVWAQAVATGIIASRRGRARAPCALLRNVRLGMAFFVKNIVLSFQRCSLVMCRKVSRRFSLPLRCLRSLFSTPHLKRNTLHDSEDERREPIVLFLSTAHDLANCGRVVIIDASSQRECQQVL